MNMRFASLAIAAGLLVAACGGPAVTTRPSTAASTTPSTAASMAPSAAASIAPTTAPTATPATEPTTPPASVPTTVSGNVDIHGSSTVAPISNAVAEDFALANPEFSYVVGDEGTGDGFELFFCVDGSDIADASRAIAEDEIALCETNRVEYVELKVAYDGLAVITHPDNALECVTNADLYALFGPESDTIGTWADAAVLAQDLGSTTVFPEGALSITAPGDESGTYDSFVDLALGDVIESRFPEDQVDANTRLRVPSEFYVASSNDNAIIQGVGGFPTSIGFVGLAYALESAEQVKIVQVDGGEGCVTPDETTVSDASYPISRPLFIYPNLNRAAENEALGAYVDYYLSDEGIVNASDVGYVALPAEELTASRTAWEAARP